MIKAVKKYLLEPIGERFGIQQWCRRPAVLDLDTKLSKYLDHRNGVFVEAGANDGIRQSNTFYLEKGLKWSGVLIEAIPELYQKCKVLRTGSKVYHGGLVPKDYPDKTIKMHYANLMSIADGAQSESDLARHLEDGIRCQSSVQETYTVDVPTITFAEVLDSAEVTKIDFLSIDLEGFELKALEGWNFEKYRPKYILFEVRDLEAVDEFMNSVSYERIDKLTHHDYLYRDERI